jgi:hypothetical protein
MARTRQVVRREERLDTVQTMMEERRDSQEKMEHRRHRWEPTEMVDKAGDVSKTASGLQKPVEKMVRVAQTVPAELGAEAHGMAPLLVAAAQRPITM